MSTVPLEVDIPSEPSQVRGKRTPTPHELLLSHKQHISSTRDLHQVIRTAGDNHTRRVSLSQLSRRSSLTPVSTNSECKNIGNGHDEKPGLALSILSGLVCGILFFALANVFSFVIFHGPLLAKHSAMGVGLHTFSIFLVGLLSARFGTCRSIIAGVDINPTFFFANCASIIEQIIHNDHTGHESLLPTLLLTISTGSALIVICFISLGYFRLTKIVQFLPTNVLSGFLAAVGFNIMAEAITVSTGIHLTPAHYFEIFGTWHGWMLLLPAFFIGVPLYFLKRHHIGPPLVILPAFLFIPIVLFYSILFISGSDINHAREKGWFYEEAHAAHFWDGWKELYAGIFHINWTAYIHCMPQLFIMIFITVMDALLKLAGTELKFEIDLDFDKEFMLCGQYNIINIFCAGSPSYCQLKFNLLNYGITHSTTDYIPAYICAGFNGLLFLIGFPLINYLPRFFLGGLVIYAGMAFVWENLWDSWWKMSKKEYMSIWAIVAINIMFDMMMAIISGVCLATFIFAFQYARRSDFGAVYDGKQHSAVLRSAKHLRKLKQYAHMVVIIALKEVLFFGSASKIKNFLQNEVRKTADEPTWKRLKFLILDFKEVTVVDGAAYDILKKVSRICDSNEINLLLSGLSENLKKRVKMHIGKELKFCVDYDHAMEQVEDDLILYAQRMRSKWLILPTMKKINEFASIKAVRGPFKKLFSRKSAIWDYCESTTYPKDHILIDAGEIRNQLIILQNGKVSFYLIHSNQRISRVRCSTRGTIVLLHMPPTERIILDKESTFIIFNKANLEYMEKKDPSLALVLHETVISDVFAANNEIRNVTRDAEADSHWDTYLTHGGKLERERITRQKIRLREIALAIEKELEYIKDNPDYKNFKRRKLNTKETIRESMFPIMPTGKEKKETNWKFQSLKNDLKNDLRNLKIQIKNIRNVNICLTPSFSQMKEYKDHFEAHAERGILDTRYLRHILLNLGYYQTKEEMAAQFKSEGIHNNKGIDLEHFLLMMCRITMKNISLEEVNYLDQIFKKHAEVSKNQEKYKTLRREPVEELFQIEFDHSLEENDAREMIEEWGCYHDNELTFEDFLSIIAFSLKCDELDSRMELDYHVFSQQNQPYDYITAQDIVDTILRQTGVRISENDAQEMLWEADIYHEHCDLEAKEHRLSLDDFVSLLTTVYEPGWIVQYNWQTKSCNHKPHELISTEERKNIKTDDKMKRSIDPNGEFHEFSNSRLGNFDDVNSESKNESIITKSDNTLISFATTTATIDTLSIPLADQKL